jgi:hypothetical protein
MKYELERLPRDISNQELLDDLLRVAAEVKSSSLARKEYKHRGKFSHSIFQYRFGSWSAALSAAGLANGKSRERSVVSRDALVDDLRRVVLQLGVTTVSRKEYDRFGKHSSATCEERFGSWIKAKEAAGLGRKPHPRISESEYFENLQRVWIRLGRQPHFSEMKNPLSAYSGTGYQRRFGSWRRALERFVECINDDATDPSASGISATLETHRPNAVAEPPGLLDMTGRANTAAVTVAERRPDGNKRDSVGARVRGGSGVTHKTQRAIGNRLKVKVLIRDGNRCRLCGVVVTGDDIHFDHVVPWSKGGETTIDNIQVLCAEHNLAKGDYCPATPLGTDEIARDADEAERA